MASSRSYLHGKGKVEPVNATCAHVGVGAGDPWVPRTKSTPAIHCRHCDVWWPGHRPAKPVRVRGAVDAEQALEAAVERDEPHELAALGGRGPRPVEAWSNVA